MSRPSSISPDVTPPARLSWRRGPTAGEVDAALVGVRPNAVMLLTDTPVPPGWPVQVALGGAGPAGGPAAAATVLTATALGADRYLMRLGLAGGRGAVTFLRAAAAHLGGGARP